MRGALVIVATGIGLWAAAPASALETSTCVVQPTRTAAAPAGCASAVGLLEATGVSVSPDGRWIDVAAPGSGAVSTFNRDGSALRQVACVSDNGTDGRDGTDGACRDGHALRGVKGVAASPDGRHVYAAAVRSGAVTAFTREADGTLTQVQCVKDSALESTCDDGRALGGARDLVVSDDGRHLYVAAGAGSVAMFARDGTTGRLAQIGCVSASGNDGACKDGTALYGASALDLAPGGRHLYVAAARSGALTTFARDPATGGLDQVGCTIADAPRAARACRRMRSLSGARSVDVSADGRRVVVAGSRAVTVLRRDADTGELRFSACASASPFGRCTGRRGLAEPFSVALTRSGVLVGAQDSVLDLPVDLTGPGTCAGPRRCPVAGPLEVVRDLALAPDGRTVYAASAGRDGLLALSRPAEDAR